MELVQNVINENDEQIEIYENEIMLAIDEACDKLHFTDLNEISQQQFKAVLRLVGRSVFKDKSKLTITDINSNIDNSNIYNNYNYNLLNNILDIYLLLCDVYSKLPDLVSFSYMCNIDYIVIDQWKYNEDLNILSYNIYKRIMNAREDRLTDRIGDSKQIIGQITVANHQFGWSAQESAKIERAKVANKTPEQIAQSYGQIEKM